MDHLIKDIFKKRSNKKNNSKRKQWKRSASSPPCPNSGSDSDKNSIELVGCCGVPLKNSKSKKSIDSKNRKGRSTTKNQNNSRTASEPARQEILTELPEKTTVAPVENKVM